jgi:mannose-1-phosphate guanylyltransferase
LATFINECRKQKVELENFIKDFPKDGSPESVDAYLAEAFPKLPKISVDYAIMENATSVVAYEAAFDWDDVGSWTALPNHLGKDERDNTIKGSVVELDSHRNIVVSEGRTVAICGVQDLVVIETKDAILVCHRDAVENIKKLSLPIELK